MPIKHILFGTEPKGGPDGDPAFSSAVIAGNTVYLAGITSGLDQRGDVIAKGDIEAQTVAVFERMRRVLESAGATFADIAKLTVFATKPEYRETIVKVRAKYVTQPPPASTLVVVSALALPDYLVEIEATAVLNGKE